MIVMPQDLIEAVETGDSRTVREWIKDDPSVLWSLDENCHKETMLHKAAREGHRGLVKQLVKAGIPIESTEDLGYTPLLEALYAGEAAIATYLIEHGADINASNEEGVTALELARESGDVDLIKLIETGSTYWFKTAADEVTRRVCKPKLGYTLTEVFNFSQQSYMLLARNAKTDSESCQMSSFEGLRHTQLVEMAEENFRRIGGKLPKEYVPTTVEKSTPKKAKPKRGLSLRVQNV